MILRAHVLAVTCAAQPRVRASYDRTGASYRALSHPRGEGMKLYAVPQPLACAISCPGRAGRGQSLWA